MLETVSLAIGIGAGVVTILGAIIAVLRRSRRREDSAGHEPRLSRLERLEERHERFRANLGTVAATGVGVATGVAVATAMGSPSDGDSAADFADGHLSLADADVDIDEAADAAGGLFGFLRALLGG